MLRRWFEHTPYFVHCESRHPSFLSPSVSVCPGCCGKVPQTEKCIKNRTLFFTPWKREVEHPGFCRGPALRTNNFRAASVWWWGGGSSLGPHLQRHFSHSSGFYFPTPITSQTSPPHIITLGIRIPISKFGKRSDIQPIVGRVCITRISTPLPIHFI